MSEQNGWCDVAYGLAAVAFVGDVMMAINTYGACILSRRLALDLYFGIVLAIWGGLVSGTVYGLPLTNLHAAPVRLRWMFQFFTVLGVLQVGADYLCKVLLGL